MAGLRIFLCLLICAAAAFVADGALSDLEQALLPQRSGGFTTKGTQFIFAFMSNDVDQVNLGTGQSDQDAVIIVTNEEPHPVEVTVEVNPNFYVNNPDLDAITFPQIRMQTVEPNSSVTFTFPVGINFPNEDIRVYRIDSITDRNSGIRVSTDGGEVSVYGINNELQSADAFTVFPCHEYNTIVNQYEYIVMGAPVNTLNTPTRNNTIMIVGCQNNTDVTLIPPFQLNTIAISVPANLGGGQTPNSDDSSHLQITDLRPLTSLILNIVGDPTGTRITSTRPIAVFTGHQCTNVPNSATESCDHVVQQVPPQLTWGTLFFTVPVVGRYSGDHYRVATTTANTQFNVTCRTLTNPMPTTDTFVINFNDDTDSGFAVFNTNIGTTSGNRNLRTDNLQWCCIESNHPVLVMQYAEGNTADMALKDSPTFGDPFMTIIPPVVQYLNDYVLPTEKSLRTSVFSVGYTIAVPQSEFFNSPSQDGSSIEANGVAVVPDEGWVELYCSNNEICGYAARVENAPSGAISIRHTNPRAAISAWVYGIAGEVSFGYSAGFKLDEVAYPILCIDNVTVNETQGQAMVTITRTGDLQAGGSRFYLTVADGTAISPDDYFLNYTVSRLDGFFPDGTFNETTRLLRMSRGVGTLTLTFSIAQDGIDEDPEDFLLFLEGARRVFVLCPVGRVTIIDRQPPPQCFDPPEIINGRVTFTGNSVGDTATYTCDSGFELIGVETTTCTQVDDTTIVFIPDPPSCRPLCPDPPAIVNGMRTFTGNSVGDTATYTCNSGFELTGDAMTTCVQVEDNSATFPSVPPPVCRPLCPDPDGILNGMRTFTGNSVGDTATYICNSNFELIGDATTTCTLVDDNSAAFPSVPPPVCRPLCPDPDGILNGMVTFTGNSVGDTATYACNSGFELTGDAMTTCTQVDDNSATFPSVPPPECRPVPECADPPEITNGRVTFTGNSVGDTATYTCASGFELIGVETTTCTQVDDTTIVFIPDPPSCRPLCPDPDGIVNGMRTFTGNSVGDTATYTCISGFELIGDATTTCTPVDDNSAAFPSVPPPVCRPLCPDPDGILNGMVTFTGNSGGDTATYTCNSGFELIGDATTTCTQVDDNSATFPPVPPPECRPLCPDPDGILNGMVTFTGNSVGDTATYACNSGFELTGDAMTTCTQVDDNSATFPSVPPPECRPVPECADPPEITNGRVTFTGNSVGDTATYTCASGFELIGVETTTCTQVDDTTIVFIPDPPSCRPLCPDPDGIVNGMRTFTGNSVGDTATYTCISGFELIGDATTTCTPVDDNSAAFPSVPPPVCRPLCPDPDGILNGMVTFTGNSVGDTATYACNSGFELTGDAMTTCTQVDDNSATFPSVPPPECRPPPPSPGCIVSEPLMVSPFVIPERYNFMGTCEHTLVTSCSSAVDFAVTVDFLATDLANGRIGVRYMNRRFIYQEDGTVDTGGEEPIGQVGDTREYADQVFITQNADGTILDFQTVGVQVIVANNQFLVNVADSTVLGETCGLCGNSDGTLLFSDRTTIANIMNTTQVMAFANSWLVPARDQFLRGIRRECAQLTNDTVIADPLFTVPFTKRGDALCYEVHGSPDQHYNLVSDVCTNVNAYYNDAIAMDNYGPFEANFIQMIGVRAVGTSGVCHNIRVFEDVNGVCSAMRMGETNVLPPMTELDGIVVRRVRNRIRISVPNCEHINLVMWITCEQRSGVRSLRFDISRGLNLRPTSHGLIGQFWNINITAEPFTGTVDAPNADLHIITVIPAEGSPRRFLASLNSIDWDKRPRPCYYAGNAQGGPWGIGPDFPVIQGRYTDYRVGGLFDHEFVFAQFQDERCL